jgi:hypothetical protein
MQWYGIPWPDVNEDAFHDLKQPLRDFGDNLQAVADSIDSALGDLENMCHAQTLTAIRQHVEEIRREFIEPIRSTCDELAGTPCDLAYDAVHDVKIGELAVLGGLVANTVFDAVATVATLGLAAPEAAAELVEADMEVRVMLNAAEGAIAALLQSKAQDIIDNFVNSIVNPFVQRVEQDVERPIDAWLPNVAWEAAGLVPGGESGGSSLHVSAGRLEHCIAEVALSGRHLDTAAVGLKAAIESIFDEPDSQAFGLPSASSVLREVLKKTAQQVEKDFEEGVKTLVDNVVHHFITLLQDFRRILEELDALVADLARKEHVAATMPVHVTPVVGVASTVAAGVAVASGLVDAEEADSVRVGEAVAVGFDATTSGEVQKVAAVDAQATAVDQAIEELIPPDDAAKVMVGVANEVSQSIDQLLTKKETDLPKVNLAGANPTGPAGVSSKVHEERPRVAGPAGSGGAGTEHLAAHHDEHNTPKVTAATAAPEGVQPTTPGHHEPPAPVVDSSPATPEP